MRMTESKPNILYVRMLGGFSVRWNGKLIAGGSKANESQLTSLLQILLHNREHGVTRDRLEELLFEDRDMSNVHHALQSVIYNTKKKLQKAGLPPVNYIEQRKGVFFWTHEIPIVEDAAEFERLYHEAEAAEDKDEQLALYQEATHWYTGEFLPNQTAVIWAAQEARRLKRIFCLCAERAAERLREEQDYFQLEELGTLASKIDPLADWEPWSPWAVMRKRAGSMTIRYSIISMNRDCARHGRCWNSWSALERACSTSMNHWM